MLHHVLIITLMMEPASTSEMSVNFYHTTRLNIPDVLFEVFTAANIESSRAISHVKTRRFRDQLCPHHQDLILIADS
jgi:hypothetical protein